MSPPSRRPAEIGSEEDLAPSKAPRIFIVEDEPVVALEIKAHLSNFGFEVCGIATRAEDALAQIPQVRPDLFLVDVNLGPGPTGLDIVELLAPQLGVPVISLTAYSDPATLEQIRRSPSSAYVTKPFDPGVLCANVSLVLQRHALMERTRAMNRELEERVRERTADLEALNARLDNLVARRTAELSTKERLLSESQRVGGIGGWSATSASGPVSWTDQSYRLFGLTPGGVQPDVDYWVSRAAADDQPALREWIDATVSGRPSAPIDFRVTLPGGEVRILHGTGELVEGEGSRDTAAIGTLQDVTGQRQQSDALRLLATLPGSGSPDTLLQEAVRGLTTLLHTEVGFIGTLVAGAPPHVRARALLVDGQVLPPHEYALGGTPSGLVMQGTVTVADRVLERFPEDAGLAELGARGYVSAPLVNSRGQAFGHVGVASRSPLRDPERATALVELFALRLGVELERRLAEERFAGLFRAAPDALLLVDTGGRITQANALATTLLQYSEPELAALTVEDLVPEANRAVHREARAMYGRNPRTRFMGGGRPFGARRKDGVVVPVEISLSPFHGEDGSRLTIVAVRDVSERIRAEHQQRALEEQLKQSQKMEALGTLAGGIAHDFNNLLAAITAHLDLARDTTAAAPVAEHLDAISTATARAANLVQQILGFGRRQPARPAVQPLLRVVEEAIRLLRATIPAGIQIVMRAEGSPASVRADATQLIQVLMNLGTNAWHAIGNGPGLIRIIVDTVLRGAAEFPPGLSVDGVARIRVVDTGSGMSAETLARALEPFFTTKMVGQGTGLGLSVAHGIVTDHGGVINIESQLGTGTTVTVCLPMEPVEANAIAVAEPAVAARAAAAPAGARVLFVEDESLFVRPATRVFERLGHTVTCAADGAEAIKILLENQGGFDVIFTDLNMPGLSGLAVASAAASAAPGAPVVLISGNRTLSNEELASANLAYALDKPFTLQDVDELLRQILPGGKRGQPVTPRALG